MAKGGPQRARGCPATRRSHGQRQWLQLRAHLLQRLQRCQRRAGSGARHDGRQRRPAWGGRGGAGAREYGAGGGSAACASRARRLRRVGGGASRLRRRRWRLRLRRGLRGRKDTQAHVATCWVHLRVRVHSCACVPAYVGVQGWRAPWLPPLPATAVAHVLYYGFYVAPAGH